MDYQTPTGRFQEEQEYAQKQNSPTNAQKHEHLKFVVLQHQNKQEKGYYMYQDWRNLHYALFNIQKQDDELSETNQKISYSLQSLLDQTLINMWRILKLINFGDDYAPTGLIYDTLLSVTKVDGTSEEIQFILKSIFFKFIQFNGKYLTDKQRQQLVFFKVIKPVIEGYRKIIARKIQHQNGQADQKYIKNGHSVSYISQSQINSSNRHEQLYRLHPVLVYKKNLEKLKKIEEEFKQCTFEPQINPSSYRVDSRYMSATRSDYQRQFVQPIDQEDQFSQQYSKYPQFQANPVPLYPEVTPIGLQQHLDRMQKSRQIKRINSLKIWKLKQSQVTAGQFSINKRSQLRKSQSIVQFKILFLIKVQVGKRIYRIKVRQNMSVNDTVKAIEKMVGFQHPDLENIVKQYYINYQRRQSDKAHQLFRSIALS